MKIDRDRLHLLHIRDALNKIVEYTKDITLDDFAQKVVTFDAVILQFMVIGEAINALSEELKEKHADIPWENPVGLRNRIAHGYFDVNPKIVWDTIQDDLPEFRERIDALL